MRRGCCAALCVLGGRCSPTERSERADTTLVACSKYLAGVSFALCYREVCDMMVCISHVVVAETENQVEGKSLID